MEDEILKKIIAEFGSNNVQVPLKVPAKLNALLEHKSNNKKAEYIRNLIYQDSLPELLKSRLYSKATEWLSKEDADGNGIVLNCKDRIKDLKEIIELATYAVEETVKFQDSVRKAEVEYLDEIRKRISKEVFDTQN